LSLPVLADPFWGRLPWMLERHGGKHSKHRKFSQPSDRVRVFPGARLQADFTHFNGGRRMYAVIRAGGKQYRVAPGDVIRVEKLGTGTDGHVEFPEVLAVSGEQGQIGKPQSEARVVGQVVEEGRGPKILVFHYKRKKQYKKLRGHRQAFTAVRITEIAFDGQSFKAPDIPKKQVRPKKVQPAEEHAGQSAEAKATQHAKKKAAPKKAAAKKSAAKKK
jgi:large subunit ribosomal protein L21